METLDLLNRLRRRVSFTNPFPCKGMETKIQQQLSRELLPLQTHFPAKGWKRVPTRGTSLDINLYKPISLQRDGNTIPPPSTHSEEDTLQTHFPAKGWKH